MQITFMDESRSVHFKALENSTTRRRELRGERVPLIGGGSYVHNQGMDITDRVLELNAIIDAEQLGYILVMADAAETITIFTAEGVFRGIIASVNPNSYPVSISVWISSEVVSSDDIIYPVAEWIDVTSDTYWTSGNGIAWDGTKWSVILGTWDGTKQYYLVKPFEAVDWTSSINPTKFRITYSMSAPFAFDFYTSFRDSNEFNFAPINSGEIYDFPSVGSVVGAQNADMYFKGTAPAPTTFEVTKIEFLE